MSGAISRMTEQEIKILDRLIQMTVHRCVSSIYTDATGRYAPSYCDHGREIGSCLACKIDLLATAAREIAEKEDTT